MSNIEELRANARAAAVAFTHADSKLREARTEWHHANHARMIACAALFEAEHPAKNDDTDHLPHGGLPEVTGGNRTVEGVNVAG